MIGFVYVELSLRVANFRAASDNTSAESDPLPQLVSYPDRKRQLVFLHLDGVFKVLRKLVALVFIAAISQENLSPERS